MYWRAFTAVLLALSFLIQLLLLLYTLPLPPINTPGWLSINDLVCILPRFPPYSYNHIQTHTYTCTYVKMGETLKIMKLLKVIFPLLNNISYWNPWNSHNSNLFFLKLHNGQLKIMLPLFFVLWTLVPKKPLSLILINYVFIISSV